MRKQEFTMKLLKIAALILIALFWADGLLFGQNSLDYYEGDVLVLRGSRELEGDFGMDLFEGDIISTGTDGLAIIELENGRTLKLREDSVIKLENLSADTRLDLQKGGVFSKVDHLLTGKFEIRAESVVAGVRGTQFFLTYGKKIEDSPDIWLCVNEGSVLVALPDSGDSTLVNKGEGINVIAGKKLTDPEQYAWTKDLNWNTDPGSGSLRDETDLDSVYKGNMNRNNR